jgi:GNAT superfamily N-acetyltransferase
MPASLSTTPHRPPSIHTRRLAILVVHPEYQRHGVGGKLIDTGLAIVDADSLPAVLESTPAGSKLYISRGFVAKGEAKVEGLDEPLPVMVRPCQSVSA